MKQLEKEIRNTSSGVILRSEEEDSRTVEGYALLFDTPSDGLPFEERIEKTALDGVIERSNVFAVLNHDNSRGILARNKQGKGTLTLEVDEKGLLYRFNAPKTALGDELLEYLRRGEVSESSFAFTVADEVWERDGDNMRRVIKSFDRLFDVSPVYDAAYSSTTVYARSYESAKKEIEEREKEEKRRELEAYYAELNKHLI